MRFCRPILVLALTVLATITSFAQVRKYSNAFLDIGAGARGMALSSAQVATVSDATAGYWNPAALVHLKSNVNFSLMHAEYFAGIAKYDYGTFAVPLKDKKSAIGFSMLRFAVDDIPNTINLFEDDGTINYDNIKSFSVSDWAFIFSFARKLKVEGLSLGGNAKIIYRNAGSFATAWGFGLDVGANYHLKQFRFGLMAKDITGTFNAWSFSFTEKEKEVLQATGNIIPENSLEVTVPKIIFAAAYEFRIKKKFVILPELDFEMTTDGKRNVPIRTDAVSFDPRFGLELSYANIIYLRGGVGNIQKSINEEGERITTVQPNIGIGIQVKTVSLDYALTNIADDSNMYSHVFSLNIGVNKRKQQ